MTRWYFELSPCWYEAGDGEEDALQPGKESGEGNLCRKHNNDRKYFNNYAFCAYKQFTGQGG